MYIESCIAYIYKKNHLLSYWCPVTMAPGAIYRASLLLHHLFLAPCRPFALLEAMVANHLVFRDQLHSFMPGFNYSALSSQLPAGNIPHIPHVFICQQILFASFEILYSLDLYGYKCNVCNRL